MAILVTGARGFLGSALVRKLHEAGYETLSILRDFSKLEEMEPSFVFHLAGKTGVLESFRSPALYYEANLDTTRFILEYCRLKKIGMHYVSGYVYGDVGDRPISEEMIPKPTNPYAHSKWMGEEMCRFYAKTFGVEITISRPFNVYGPGQSTQFFIPKMIEQALKNCDIRLRDLESKRDYVFIEDVAEALIAIMKRGKSSECYNIGFGISHSCKEVVAEIQKGLRVFKPVLVENPILSKEVSVAWANIEKIEREVGWRPVHSLSMGLAKCLDF
jgi:nucleoside-diphosphate-sugar epimerase